MADHFQQVRFAAAVEAAHPRAALVRAADATEERFEDAQHAVGVLPRHFVAGKRHHARTARRVLLGWIGVDLNLAFADLDADLIDAAHLPGR